MILRKFKAGLMLLVVIWLLTGCMKMNVDLVVNRHGFPAGIRQNEAGFLYSGFCMGSWIVSVSGHCEFNKYKNA